MTYGSLFSGIGGMDLGLERAGMFCRWQVEIDPFCRKVLTKHWPDVPKYEDVRHVGAANLAPVDLICGGFPCQPVSVAGKQLAQADPRWLWPEFFRIVRELRPGIVFVENVPGLLTHGMGDVLGDLASIGYDAEWESLPASAFGAPHRRERVFVVAYPADESVQEPLLGGAIGLHGEPRRMGRHDVSGDHWSTDQPPMVGMAYGDGGWVDVARALGNAVVPQVAEWIGRRIMSAGRTEDNGETR